MTSESLNIKLSLDISDISQTAKKVKAQLSSMADSVKSSIPKIGTESKKAKDSLAKVSDAGEDVQKSIAGIGKEASKSLSGVVAQSNRLTSALNALGIASHNAQGNTVADGLADGTAEANAGLEEMQGTMQSIAALDFGSVLFSIFNAEKFVAVKKAFADIKASTSELNKEKAELSERVKSLGAKYDEFAKSIENTNADIKEQKKQFEKLNEEHKELIKNQQLLADLDKKIKSTRVEAWKSLGAAIGNTVKKIVLYGAAITAIVATINALSISKLAKQMYTTAQQAGFSAQGYQEWAYVLERAGVEAQELGEIMKTLNEAQVDVIDGNEDMIKAYERLGFTAEEVARMNSEELWNNTIKALQNVENTTERTSIAYKLFSEDTAKLATVLNLSNEETQQLISSYNTLGGAMSKNLIKNSSVLQGALVNLRAAWQGLRNTLAQYVIPIVIVVVEWLTKAIVAVNAFLKTFFGLDMTPMTENMSSGMDKVGSSIGGIGGAADEATKSVEKLRRTTMGFDELNIVGNPNASSADSSGAASGAGAGSTSLAGMNAGQSIFAKASEEAEAFKKKMEDFFNKYKVQIAIIGTALATLGVSKLISGLGSALGLGDKFLGVMKNISKFATSAIVVTLQVHAVYQFMKNFMEGEGIKNYIMGLVTAAIGTGILWATWGPTGLAIGLGVTAVASIKAVIDGGGLSTVEGATVGLTGLAAAVASVVTAVATAVAKIKNIGFIEAVKLIFTTIGTNLKTWWLALLPKITGALTVLKTGIATALNAVKTAIVTAVKFLIANPIALIIAAIVAAVALIAVKGDEIQKALNKVSDWIKKIFVRDWREVFGNTLGTIMNGAVKIFGDVLGNIKKVLNGIIDFIRGVFTGNWRRAWDGIKSIFSGMFNGLVAVAKAPINAIITLVNGMLSGITSGFNAVKRALNKLSIKVPDWVPSYGGKTFGFNLSMSTAPKIPMLANGGIVTGDTLARIGERGREAVLPLEQNTGWMDQLADRIAARNSTPTRIALIVDGKELGWATINNINAITKQTGGLQLEIA